MCFASFSCERMLAQIAPYVSDFPQVHQLAGVGGTTPQSGSARVLAQLFTDSIGQQFSLFGQKGKKPFAHLELFNVTQSKLFRCIKGLFSRFCLIRLMNLLNYLLVTSKNMLFCIRVACLILWLTALRCVRKSLTIRARDVAPQPNALFDFRAAGHRDTVSTALCDFFQ